MFCLSTSSNLYRQWFEFSLKVMRSSPGHLLKSVIFYIVLTHKCRTHQWWDQSYHNKVHNSAYLQARSLLQCIFWTLHQTGTLFPRWNLTQKCSTCFPRSVVEGSVFALLLRRPQILNDRILMLDKRSNGSDPPGLILQALRWLISKKNVKNFLLSIVYFVFWIIRTIKMNIFFEVIC